MNNNISTLVVANSEFVTNLNTIPGISITEASNANEALHKYAEAYKLQGYDIVFMQDDNADTELELLKSIIELNSKQHCVLLLDDMNENRMMQFIRAGGSGVINTPYTAAKLRLELEKFSYLQEDSSDQQLAS